jgi:hypothetical protein
MTLEIAKDDRFLAASVIEIERGGDAKNRERCAYGVNH